MSIHGLGDRKGWLSATLAALFFLAAWLPWHPARPPLPTADLYTHLAVARHLARGDGFLNDVTYPLSFAFPFARALPQPLINRQPGFALLLTVPYTTASGDPNLTLAHTRLLQVLILGLIVLLGLRGLQASGRSLGVLPWFAILGSSPLLAFAVDWGFVELIVGGMLLLLWLRARTNAATGPRLADGLLWGALLLFRLDLFWLLPLWWWGRRFFETKPASNKRQFWRQMAWTILVALIVMSPWLIRNARLTGQPFFTLQSQAELVKDTSNWPGYQVYRRLDPQPPLKVMSNDPMPVLRKAGRGMKFFWRDSRRFFPPLLLLGFAVSTVVALRRRSRQPNDETEVWCGPSLAFVTYVLLCAQYAFFDHSLRHVLVLLPILAWEAAHYAGRDWRRSLAVSLTVFLPLAQVPGWDQAARQAQQAAQSQPWLRDREQLVDDQIYFFDHSAGPWFLDRPGIWRSPTAEAKIPELLAPEISEDN